MDPATAASGKILEQLLTVYGPPGLIIAVLMLVVWRLFNLYITQVEKDHQQGIDTLDSLNKLTTAIDSLKDLIKRGDNK